jgi:hypothetical protein
MHDPCTRRSDRVHLVFPIQVAGTDAEGRDFTEKGRTSVVGRHGAAIVLTRRLATDQELMIRCFNNNKEAGVRVVGVIGGQDSEYVYGIVLLSSVVNLWDVEFPSLTGSEKTLARILLRCGGCQGREVVHLNEIELEVFNANHNIHRFCKSCAALTFWKQESQEVPRASLPHLDEHMPEQESSPAQPRPAQEKPHEVRIQTKLTGCIRQPGFPDEVVLCENLSRGGCCFRSRKRYLEGSRIEIAVPCSRENGNIFVPARIVYAKALTSGDLFRHGAAHVRAYE